MNNNSPTRPKGGDKEEYKKKLITVAVCGGILFLLIILGLIKVILDENREKNAAWQNTPTPTPTELLTPTPSPEPTITEVPVITEPVKEAPLIVIDAGHGGEDDGTVSGDYIEKNANLAIALYLEEELEELGYRIYMIRTDDTDVEKKQRTVIATEMNADAYVSIHINSFEVSSIQGTEVWYSDLRDDGSAALAQAVVDAVTEATGSRNRGIKCNNELIVLKYNGMPACLVECGYITSPVEREKLFDASYQKLIAEGIARGVAEFLPIDE